MLPKKENWATAITVKFTVFADLASQKGMIIQILNITGNVPLYQLTQSEAHTVISFRIITLYPWMSQEIWNET